MARRGAVRWPVPSLGGRIPPLSPRLAALLTVIALVMGFLAGWLDDLLLDGHYLLLAPLVFLLIYGIASAGALLLFARVQRERHDPLAEVVAMTPPQLSAAVAAALRAQGYRNVRRSADGVEIVCRDRDGLIVVQCRRTSSHATIGSGEVLEFIEMLAAHRPTPRGIFITTGQFTQPAQILARKYHMTLVDGPHLVEMLQEWTD